MNNNIIVVVVVWILFEVKVDVYNFDVGCWIRKDFGVDFIIWEFVLLRECPFDRKVVEVSKMNVVRGFGVMNKFG